MVIWSLVVLFLSYLSIPNIYNTLHDVVNNFNIIGSEKNKNILNCTINIKQALHLIIYNKFKKELGTEKNNDINNINIILNKNIFFINCLINSVKQNLIIHGFKICNSCKLSKTIFPL